jgi:Cu-Zn family superoxide dismutase
MAKKTNSCERAQSFFHILRQSPSAVAHIKGSEKYSTIEGHVSFYQTPDGVLVSAQVFGLPAAEAPCRERIFAVHIHSGGSCTGDREDPFKNTLTHYNPGGCAHPSHAGDLLPLFGNDGYAFEVFLTDRFSVDEIIGRTVVIHLNPDDFTTQPSGNSGEKIACGQIERNDACAHPCSR